MLLVITYGYCRLCGLNWYLEQVKVQQEALKKNEEEEHHKKTDGDKPPSESSPKQTSPDEDTLEIWEFAKIAYSAYGCILPWAAYVCYHHSDLRVSLRWATTTLMVFKLFSTLHDETDKTKLAKMYSVVLLYFPTYGGYAVYKTSFST